MTALLLFSQLQVTTGLQLAAVGHQGNDAWASWFAIVRIACKRCKMHDAGRKGRTSVASIDPLLLGFAKAESLPAYVNPSTDGPYGLSHGRPPRKPIS